MLILLLNEIPCRPLADYMQSVKFEFVLKKNKAENRILNDFTLLNCKLRLNLTFKSQFQQFPEWLENQRKRQVRDTFEVGKLNFK